MPPVRATTARWLSPGKVNVIIRGESHVLPWEEAMELAKDITESLRLERRG
jgi:hypothetical protein